MSGDKVPECGTKEWWLWCRDLNIQANDVRNKLKEQISELEEFMRRLEQKEPQ